MSHANTQKFKQSKGLDVHEADDGLILFNPESDKVHHLNSTAGVLFLLCEQPTSYAELTRKFEELFEETPADFTAVDEVLEQMTEDGILLRVGE